MTAAVVLVVLAGWAFTALAVEQRALVRAQRDGSDPVQVLSGIRVLALRAQADEGLALSARGSGAANLEDFDAALKMLGVEPGASGLLARRRSSRRRQEPRRRRAPAARPRPRTTDALHDRVVALQSEGRFAEAVNLSAGSRQLALADAIRAELDRLIAAGQRRFVARGPRRPFRASAGLGVGIPLLTLACALLALYGLWLRIREYR